MNNPEQTGIPGKVPEEGKKKKKRSRKKKSKKSADDKSTGSSADDSSHQTVEQKPVIPGAAAAASKMNPHDILRNRIMAEGFSARQVDRAMEEMWDKNLAYDEYDAVFKYLKGEKDEKKEKTSSSPSSVHREVGDTATATGDGVEEDEDEVEPEEAPAKAASKASPPMSMEQRLEMVASFENMTDAIFALTEWVSKAAKPQDLKGLCATTKTMALVTIFRRSITEPKDQAHFKKYVLPSMVRLMESLLGKSGIPPAATAETQRTFEPLLKQARQIYEMQPEAKDFAERVSRFIVARISLAIGETNDLTVNGALKPPKTSFAASTDAPGAIDGRIAEVLSTREIHMTAAKRYGVLARSACASLRGGPAAVVNGDLIGETAIDKDDIMSALVGEDAKASYELQMADLEELKAQAKQQESGTAQELRNAIEELNEERDSIRKRIFELKQSIEKLQAYDAELCVKVNDAQVELEAETAQASAEAVTLNEKIQEATESVKYGTSILALVNTLKSYDDSLEKAIHASAPMPDGNLTELATQQMDVYISRVRSYFQSEADTMDYLRKRLEATAKAVADLKLEIVECEGLGMNTTIGQMNESLKTKEALIEHDAALLERFSAESSSMFDAFICRLEEYKGIELSKALQPFRTDTFGDIRESLERLGVTSIHRLDPFITTMNGDGNSNPTVPVLDATPKAVGMIATSEEPMAGKNAVNEKPPAMPKFTWAAAKSTGDTSAKTSLLDIQREELKSKDTE